MKMDADKRYFVIVRAPCSRWSSPALDVCSDSRSHTGPRPCDPANQRTSAYNFETCRRRSLPSGPKPFISTQLRHRTRCSGLGHSG
jgi:hypothetical protein